MGTVCAKNDAGKVATDAPRPAIKRDKTLLSSQSGPLEPAASTEIAQCPPTMETKFVDSTINFNTDKGIEKKADQLAEETAAAWCATNTDWEYAGEWKNTRVEGTEGEVSQFQVRKKTSATGSDEVATAAETTEETKKEEEKKEVVDEKKSFVDQVSEGLIQKVSPDRFEKNEEPAPVTTEEVDDEDAKEKSDDAEEEKKEDAAAKDGEASNDNDAGDAKEKKEDTPPRADSPTKADENNDEDAADKEEEKEVEADAAKD